MITINKLEYKKGIERDMNTVLIIDDEPTIRMLLSRILELEGYEVMKAKDRATALYTLKKHEVQVVL